MKHQHLHALQFKKNKKNIGALCRVLAIWLVAWLGLFNLVAPAFADEISGLDTPVADSPVIASSNNSQVSVDRQDTPLADNEQHDTVIATGNATSSADVSNVINTNIATDATTTIPAQLEGGATASSAPVSDFSSSSASSTLDSNIVTSGAVTIDIDNTNGAVATTTAAAQASTGGNEASSTAGNVSIQTGDGTATVNLVNVVNTNITGSDGLFLLLNALGGLTEDVDVRNEIL